MLGLAFAYVFLPYPLVYTTLLALVLFRIYYWGNTIGTPPLAVLMLVAVTLVPMLSVHFETRDGGMLMSLSYAGSAGVAITVFLLVHLIVPDRNGSHAKTSPGTESDPGRFAKRYQEHPGSASSCRRLLEHELGERIC